MSNAFGYTLSLLASSPAVSHTLISLLAVGTIVLLVWIVRRIANPQKLLLGRSPGRSNAIHPGHIVVVFLFWLLAGQGAMEALKQTRLNSEHILILAGLIRQVIALVLALVTAKFCFRLGLRRGMGLSMRHWAFDTGRGAVGFLAVFPVCFALAYFFTWLMPEVVQPHPLLEALGRVEPAWKAGIVLSAVVMAPLAEELLFRGLLQSMLRRYLNSPWLGVLISSAIFSMFHLNTPQNIPALFVLSVVLGYNYERCGRLWPSILIHMLFNASMISLKLMG